MDFFLEDETATLAFGQQLAAACDTQASVIFLQGDLGAGKTTLSRGFLSGLGHHGKVKSPTYTLVEQYQVASNDIYHFDLYRLTDPEELEYLGLDDYFNNQSICLVEWPERGSNYLPQPDIILQLSYQNHSRTITVSPQTELGKSITLKLEK
jgi:tRNA threonylcarbamoyladenosine biosynthesis protein TsaE